MTTISVHQALVLDNPEKDVELVGKKDPTFGLYLFILVMLV